MQGILVFAKIIVSLQVREMGLVMGSQCDNQCFAQPIRRKQNLPQKAIPKDSLKSLHLKEV